MQKHCPEMETVNHNFPKKQGAEGKPNYNRETWHRPWHQPSNQTHTDPDTFLVHNQPLTLLALHSQPMHPTQWPWLSHRHKSISQWHLRETKVCQSLSFSSLDGNCSRGTAIVRSLLALQGLSVTVRLSFRPIRRNEGNTENFQKWRNPGFTFLILSVLGSTQDRFLGGKKSTGGSLMSSHLRPLTQFLKVISLDNQARKMHGTTAVKVS